MRNLNKIHVWKTRAVDAVNSKCMQILTAKSSGIDGLLVTVGLCIIALVLCVVMKDSLTTFITTIVNSLQEKAVGILDVSKI